jgi:hypothetical protein
MKEYPEAVENDCGCKVGWLFFDNEEDAKACGIAAEHNANILESQGYDFGFQSPGEVLAPNSVHNQSSLWKVTIP